MTGSIARRFIGVVIGVIVALITVALVEAIGHRVFPPPPGLDLTNLADVAQMVAGMSGGALSIVLIAWFLGSFLGGWVALRFSYWRIAPLIVSAIVIAGALQSFVMIPHPVWMMAAGLTLPALAALLLLRRTQLNA
jgi:predicted ferric reductase